MGKILSPQGRRRRRAWSIAAAVLAALLLTAFFLRTRILTAVGSYLVVEDRLQPSDLIFVLNGDPDSRPFLAADLYAQGLAPRIVIARSENRPTVNLDLVRNETDISVGVMEKLGVPEGSLLVLSIPGGVTSTFDEARLLRDYVDANEAGSLILVTSAFHTRRARWIFEHELEGSDVRLEVAAAPQHGFDAGDWWQSEGGLITVNNEYIKLLFYIWKYR